LRRVFLLGAWKAFLEHYFAAHGGYGCYSTANILKILNELEAK
jgi:hypothetical protein